MDSRLVSAWLYVAADRHSEVTTRTLAPGWAAMSSRARSSPWAPPAQPVVLMGWRRISGRRPSAAIRWRSRLGTVQEVVWLVMTQSMSSGRSRAASSALRAASTAMTDASS